MTGETDRHYIDRCLAGHREDFCHLVVRYQKPLLAAVRCRQRAGVDAAEDVAQEAFVRAYERLASLEKPESFFSWLIGIAYRILLERAGRAKTERAALARLARETPTTIGADVRDDDPALDAALASLPDPYREVVLLRFYGDCSCSEIATRLQIPIGTVTKRLSRAYETLRDTLLGRSAPEKIHVLRRPL
jgi:RNA polymerase sigma-70 factor, ECF subfamily